MFISEVGKIRQNFINDNYPYVIIAGELFKKTISFLGVKNDVEKNNNSIKFYFENRLPQPTTTHKKPQPCHNAKIKK